MFLDLTAAFDTVDYTILISSVQHCVGIRETAVLQVISVCEILVRLVTLHHLLLPPSCGIPQGSILVPILFFFILSPPWHLGAWDNKAIQ